MIVKVTLSDIGGEDVYLMLVWKMLTLCVALCWYGRCHSNSVRYAVLVWKMLTLCVALYWCGRCYSNDVCYLILV